jgi:propanol-preferring alcohol dehydrogenase
VLETLSQVHKRRTLIRVGSASSLVFGGRSISGALTGTAIDNQDALGFSVLANIPPIIETLPLEQAADAYARMMQGQARFRTVLTMNA